MGAGAAATRNGFWSLAGWVSIGLFSLWLCVVAAITLLVGTPYFLTDEAARVDHALHELYRPAGLVGLMTGFLGTGLMVVLLLYSVRKWLPLTGFMGAPPWWMRFHMVCGILGPVFIVLHEGFQLPTGIVGMGFWLMLFVGFSGVFGRYFFGYIPTTAAGRRAAYQAQAQAMQELAAQLVTETREEGADQVQEALALARAKLAAPQNLGELALMDLEVRRRVEVIRALLWRAGLPSRSRRRAMSTLTGQLQTQRGIAGLAIAQRYSKYWQLFHQPLAMAMYVIIVVHVLQALAFGGVIPTLLSALPG